MSKPLIENVKCPECQGEMISRSGKFGVFWGCKSYPSCKGTRDSQGRSKADREEYKRSINKDNEDKEVLDDVLHEVRKYDESYNLIEEQPKTSFTFNKKQ